MDGARGPERDRDLMEKGPGERERAREVRTAVWGGCELNEHLRGADGGSRAVR